MSIFRPRTVSDIMTRSVVTLFETDRLDIIETGLQQYRFRHLPVVNERGKLIGLVTQRDLLRAAPSSLEPELQARQQALWSRFRVADIMIREVLTAPPDLPLHDAGAIMRDRKLGCLPVTEPDGKLVGVVTEADFLNLAVTLLDRWT
jgi:CBS domain-containing protein